MATTNSPTPKVVAATGGGGLGFALQVIGVYIWESVGNVDIPQRVEDAVGFVLVTLLALVFGYAAPSESLLEPAPGEPVDLGD